MLALLQRVTHAQVKVDNQIIGAIKQGILVFLAVEPNDTEKEANRLIERILGYRIFSDQNDRMNLSVVDIQAELLIVPQFTLAADTTKGMRPSFTSAAPPELGNKLFNYFLTQLKNNYPRVATGKFGANMQISLCNDGPVTLMLRQQNNPSKII